MHRKLRRSRTPSSGSRSLRSVLEGPSFWIAAGKDLWEALGKITLEAAGIEEVTDEDCRSTWQEILNQTLAGVAAAMTADLAREITAVERCGDRSGTAGVRLAGFFSLRRRATKLVVQSRLDPGTGRSRRPEPEEVRGPGGQETARFRRRSTFCWKLRCRCAFRSAGPLCRFGKCLKLNTGSIVELDRFVTDPVEVIVNDCVIARGEVVVVDGNYGVRISQLASREDRLRSGMAESAHKGSKP